MGSFHLSKSLDNRQPATSHGSDVQAVFCVVIVIIQIQAAVRWYISTALLSIPNSAAKIEWILGERKTHGQSLVHRNQSFCFSSFVKVSLKK